MLFDILLVALLLVAACESTYVMKLTRVFFSFLVVAGEGSEAEDHSYGKHRTPGKLLRRRSYFTIHLFVGI